MSFTEERFKFEPFTVRHFQLAIILARQLSGWTGPCKKMFARAYDKMLTRMMPVHMNVGERKHLKTVFALAVCLPINTFLSV